MNPEQKIEQMEIQIAALTKRIDSINNYSTIPIPVENAFKGRGFLNKSSLVFGRSTVGGGGTSVFPVNGLNSNSMIFANYVDAAASSGTPDASIELSGSTYVVHLEGTAPRLINYVIFLNDNTNILL